MNPFDLAGPEFLLLYLVVLFLAVILALGIRWWMRQPSDEPPAEVVDLPPYAVAYLAGGERRAIDAAIVRLIQAGVLGIDASSGRLSRRGEMLTAKAHPLEDAIFQACDAESGSLLHVVRPRVSTTANQLRKRLIELGLLVSDRQASLVQLVPACALLAATLFGLIKIFVGLGRHRPVGFLILLVILSVAVAVVFFLRRPFRSRRGDRAVQHLEDETAALRYAAGPRVNDLAEADLIMALGLFGMGVLAGGPLARLPAALRIGPPAPPRPAGSSSSCSGWVSSCGSAGGGGCGGGGGGCGGGGCGGCGGG